MEPEAYFYDEVVAPLQRRMVGAVWRIVGEREATNDIIQDVLLELLRRADQVRRHPNPAALILRICHHRAIDHLRRQRRRHAVLEELHQAPPGQADRPGPDRAYQLKERREEVLGALARLPRREAEAITLHAVDGLSYEELARAMGCRASTARVLVARARKRLKRLCGKTTALNKAETAST